MAALCLVRKSHYETLDLFCTQGVDVPQLREETVEAVRLVPRERVQHRTAEQIEDASQFLEEIVEMVRTVE